MHASSYNWRDLNAIYRLENKKQFAVLPAPARRSVGIVGALRWSFVYRKSSAVVDDDCSLPPPPPLSIPKPETNNRTHSVTISLPAPLISAPEDNDSNSLKQIKPEKNFSHRFRLSISSNKFSKLPREERFHDSSYDSFKTWTGKLEKQISNLRAREQSHVINNPQNREAEALPTIKRYFDALKGPELDTLRASEEPVLPRDKKWPFLLRFPISSFGICLGVGSQAMLWKSLATSPFMKFLNISPKVNLVLWFTAVLLFCSVFFIYALKTIFYFEAVRREYYHPVRINFFFAPWIACLFLAISLPQQVGKKIPGVLWYLLMSPILVLELKIYGQWMSGGGRRLSKVANPSNHLAVVGNFVGALLGASMGLKEGPIFFFAVGVAHYTVLFVTLYQRLPSNGTLPKELHPVFFLFVAAPSVACTAWAKIFGEFGVGARIPYFIAMFSLAWWAYTFPMAGSAIATIRYTAEVNNVCTRVLSVALSLLSTVTVLMLLINTILHGLVLKDLFPNDITIAISCRKAKSKSKNKCRSYISPDIEAPQSPPAL
ncbi:S-type anion channel SLAH3 [Platanthera guangdongensis]|uniref:S-type anion channel SLAH3 n=1 Tax=Platanthera guangdongensis TaxID=2320717 RepID=A0ABR2N2M1_9ASPA